MPLFQFVDEFKAKRIIEESEFVILVCTTRWNFSYHRFKKYFTLKVYPELPAGTQVISIDVNANKRYAKELHVLKPPMIYYFHRGQSPEVEPGGAFLQSLYGYTTTKYWKPEMTPLIIILFNKLSKKK